MRLARVRLLAFRLIGRLAFVALLALGAARRMLRVLLRLAARLRTGRVRVDRVGAGLTVRIGAVVLARAAALIAGTLVAVRDRPLLAIVAFLAIRRARSVLQLATDCGRFAIAYGRILSVLFLAVLR